MKVTQLLEMAKPKKICPECGRGTLEGHYWYKGGWRCKKPKDDVQEMPRKNNNNGAFMQAWSKVSSENFDNVDSPVMVDLHNDDVDGPQVTITFGSTIKPQVAKQLVKQFIDTHQLPASLVADSYDPETLTTTIHVMP